MPADLRRDLLTAAIAMLVLTVLLGLGYPLLTTGVSQLLFPGKANGSRILVHGVVVGSSLIGQSFGEVVYRNGREVTAGGSPVTRPDPRYFQSRPSATVPADDGEGSAFSNLGPNSRATRAEIAANISAYLALEGPHDPGLDAARVPVDAADSSASGLDPDISPANADIQARRVAAVRRLPLAEVDRLIGRYTTPRSLGFLGEPGVDVLELNLALDRIPGGAAR